MSKTLELLLRPETPDVRKELPTKEVEITRLSVGEEKCIFTIRAMTLQQVAAVLERPQAEQDAYSVVLGCVDPDFKDVRLQDKAKGILTPEDAVKALLLPGELRNLTRQIDALGGYRGDSVVDVKNG